MCFYIQIKVHRGLLRWLWEAKSVFVCWIKSTFQRDKMFFTLKTEQEAHLFDYSILYLYVLTSKQQRSKHPSLSVNAKIISSGRFPMMIAGILPFSFPSSGFSLDFFVRFTACLPLITPALMIFIDTRRPHVETFFLTVYGLGMW